jgi:hypothetical protein
MKWVSVLAVAGLCAACGGGTTPANQAATANEDATGSAAAAPAPAPQKPEYREVTLPAGTTLSLSMKSQVASDTSRVEQPVHAELRAAVKVNGETVIPAGADVNGVVTEARESGRVKGRARVGFRFTSLKTGGETYDIKTANVAREARATKGKDVRNIAIGAGAGAALGAIFGGGSGAAKGAALGGAGGAGYDLATKGEEVRLGPGAAVTTRLTAPLTIRVKV